MDINTPEAYFKDMPSVTRAILVGTFTITLTFVLGLFNIRWILLDWTLVYKKLHLWRLCTDYFFAGPFSFGWLFHMYFFTTFSSKLERHPSFASNLIGKGGYLFFIFLQMISLDLLSLVFYPPTGKPLLAGSLNFAIIYYWSKKEPFATIGLWGFSFTAWQAPYALVVLDVLMGQSIWDNLMGIATGHLYHFIRDVLPVEKNIHLLNRTPAIFGTLTEKLDFMSTSTPSSSAPRSTFYSSSGTTGSSSTQSTGGGFGTLFGRATGSGGSSEFPGRGYRLGEGSVTSNNN